MQFREVEVVHGEQEICIGEVVIIGFPRCSTCSDASCPGCFLHALVGRVARMLVNGAGGIAGDAVVQSTIDYQFAKSGFGGGRTADVAPANKYDV